MTVVPVTFPASPQVGVAFDVTLSATGGAGPYSFSIASGALPDGLSMAVGGAITGMPTTHGQWDVTIQAHDANGLVGAQEYSGAMN